MNFCAKSKSGADYSENFLDKRLTKVVSDLFVHSFDIFCWFSLLYMLYEISLSIKPIILIKLIMLIEKSIIINYSHQILLSIFINFRYNQLIVIDFY